MARRRQSNHLSTIEYIGPRPQKPQKRPNFFGGWVVLLLAGAAVWMFGKPFLPFVRAQQTPASLQAAEQIINDFEKDGGTGKRIAAGALKQTRSSVSYDSAYYKISYPWGDIPSHKGKAEDLVIRAYRTSIGVDLQQLVHEDMTRDFSAYSGLLETTAPDPSNDHRRAANLERYFERHGERLTTSRTPEDYQPGDVVVWTRPDSPVSSKGQIARHIGIVVPGPGDRANEPWVVHHLDTDVKWENVLFDFQIIGHYRFYGDQTAAGTASAPATKEEAAAAPSEG